MSFARDFSPATTAAPIAGQPASPARPARWQGTQPSARYQGVTPDPALAAADNLGDSYQRALAADPDRLAPGAPPVVLGDRSRLHLAARAGVQLIEVGTIAAYDAASNTAMVRLLGTQANLIGPLPLAGGLAPSQAVPGANCLVVLLDLSNPADAAIVALYDAPPQLWTQAGSATLVLGSYQSAQAVSFPVAFGTGTRAVAATSRHPDFLAAVSGETSAGFVLTVTRREGASQWQAGLLNVPVAAGAGSGSAPLLFPASFATARAVVACAALAGWTASVSALGASGCTLTVSSAAVGPVTVGVYWQALGDPVVSASVDVDWQAAGV